MGIHPCLIPNLGYKFWKVEYDCILTYPLLITSPEIIESEVIILTQDRKSFDNMEEMKMYLNPNALSGSSLYLHILGKTTNTKLEDPYKNFVLDNDF
jgi:hypothetical protein